MKKLACYLLLLSAVVIFQKNAIAQAKLSALKIFDLNQGVEVELDSTVSKEGKSRLFVNFKLSDVSLADSVFFKFGTTKEGAEVTTETGEFKKSGSVYSVKTQGPSYVITNSEAACRIKITKKQLRDCKFLSLVVKDKTGLYTNVLNTRIN
jgi:hypothetical protein